MNITETKFEDKIQLSLEGRIDVNSSAQLQDEILKAFQKRKTVILDFAGSDYISSAGIRALLIGKKTAAAKGGDMPIVNVCDSIRNVIRMAGMGTILNIQ